jgi:pyruvate dehydrogenase E1 component alpha subunit
MYAAMTTARQCDERVHTLLKSGQMGGIWLSSRGHEAVGAAIGTAMERDDYLVTYYRGLPEQLAKGMSLKHMWAEWLGKATGTCKGKGGGIHVVDPDVGVMANSGIIGAGLPIATGLAVASQIRGDGRVAVCTFGDGAVNQGSFHESLNLAGLWKLPVVYYCENNLYAETTAMARATSVEHIADRAAAYAIPGVKVDGNDPVATYEAARTAIERARAGEGPTLIEATTYRLMGHYNLDTMSYIPEEELAAAVAADPVPAYRARLLTLGVASEEDLADIDKRAAEEVEEAWLFAKDSPHPDLDELLRDVTEVQR